MMKQFFIVLMLLPTFCAQSQNRPTRYLTDILEEALQTQSEEIIIEDVVLSYKNLVEAYMKEPGSSFVNYDVFAYLSDKMPSIPLDSAGRIVIEKHVTFKNVSGYLELSTFAFNSGLTIEGQNQHNYFAEIELNVDNCSFGSFRILAKTESPMITNSFFSQSDISLVMDKIESPFVVGMANIQNNIFASNSYFHLTGFDDFNLTENTFIKNSTIRLDQVVDAALENNHFASGSLSIRNSSLENLVFRDNRSQGPVSMSLSSIRNKIKIHENELDGGFALSEVLLPEFYVDISWNQLKGHKLFIELDTRESGLDSLNQNCIACIPYYGSSASELDNDYGFKKLISTYTGLYRIYKENGDIESANEVYVELQQLYTRRYLHQYTTEGGMNNWFRWKLNQLLEAYIGYGTDPTRALIKSFYILLVFSIFYFFFPSEWDTASKRELLSHFKNAVSTNNNKTKAAIRFIGYLLLSLLNAMTLSLNAFVTLGFGTIPTKGFARYVCIIQGFMGWFLLSLFTVALINQVIF